MRKHIGVGCGLQLQLALLLCKINICFLLTTFISRNHDYLGLAFRLLCLFGVLTVYLRKAATA